MDICSMVREYRNYKVIYNEMINIVKNNYLVNPNVLYRGDCIYEKFLKVGQVIKFYNYVSSWTSDYTVAKGFSNIGSVPEWYYMESQWLDKEPYPFKSLDKNTLIPVIFKMKSKHLRGLKVSDYIDVDTDTEYVAHDEKEYILGNILVKILAIQKYENRLIVIVDAMD